ncbi:MAG: glycosyltransferase [Methylococcales bacterium]
MAKKNKPHSVFLDKNWDWVNASCVPSDRAVAIPEGLYLLWATHNQIRDRYNIATLSGRIGLVAWWFMNGEKEYPAVPIKIEMDERLFEAADVTEQNNAYPVSKIAIATAELNDEFIQSLNLTVTEDRIKLINWYYDCAVKGKRQVTEYELAYFFEEASDVIQDTVTKITRAMMLIWYAQADIRKKYNLSTKDGRIKFESWWFCFGYKEAAPYKLSEHQLSAMLELATEIEQDTYMPIIRAMLVCWSDRDDLKKLCNLDTRIGRMRLSSWWLLAGHKDIPPYDLTLEQRYEISKEAVDVVQDSRETFTGEMAIIWNSDTVLKETYDIYAPQGRRDYLKWWNKHSPKYAEPTSSQVDDEIEFNSLDAHPENERKCVVSSYLAGGLNLIGLAKGELGIGEDVRMAARSMGVAKVNYSVFNFPRHTFSRQKDVSLADHINEELIYNVNMVSLTGFEHSSIFSTYGREFFDKRFTIGAWPWELPTWPRVCDGVFNLVDEIWASSKYAVDAYSYSPVPVVHMPMAVDFDSIPEYTRDDFNLPTDSYLFLYVFDSLSYMARKNPIAHLEAFWKAFPRTCSDVSLVVKTMNADYDNETWNKFHAMVASDDRIILISETFSRDKILGLMNNCDAFLSLHRAEGFGRCIAEMMWLGKPVVATNFSGNTDFTTKETAFLVDGPLVVVKPGEYPYGEDQYWCNPDIEQAACHMQACYEGGGTVNNIATAGKIFIKQNYSFQAVAKKYTERLNYLGIL